jgi:hypothetical protein
LTTFSIFDAMLLGALGMAAAMLLTVLVVFVLWKVVPQFVSIVSSLKTITPVLRGILEQLSFMQQVTQAAAPPNFGVDPGAIGGTPAPGGGEPSAPVAYPAPVFDRFQIVPDAKVEDTDPAGLTQDDADLVRMEQIEALRQRGIEVEDSDTEHEGVEADAE